MIYWPGSPSDHVEKIENVDCIATSIADGRRKPEDEDV